MRILDKGAPLTFSDPEELIMTMTAPKRVSWWKRVLVWLIRLVTRFRGAI